MAGKRKIIRQRTSRKTKPKKSKKTDTEEEDSPSPNHNDSGFTREEEEEPLSIHIHPSPKRSPRNRTSKAKKSTSTSVDIDHVGEEKSVGDDRKDVLMDDTDNDEDNDENGDESDDGEEDHKNKYEVRERVLARDEDGILYYANIRRKLYGINHQQSISCLGIFDLAPEQILESQDANKKDDEGEDREPNNNNNNNEIDDKSSQANHQSNEWHYFVHYEGWKTLWDRWVSSDDIMEATPDNLERMNDISKTHKAFQLEFKGKTKKKKIQNGGLFLQQWKQKLDALNRRYDEKLQEKTVGAGADASNDKGNKGASKEEKSSKQKAASVAANNKRKAAAATAKKKKSGSSPQEILRDRSELVIKSCLTNRQSSHIQAIPLSFGLKRILVEDWENLNNSNVASTDSNRNTTNDDEHSNRDMVHVLPAKVTIRDALSLYLKEKGILWDGETKRLSTINTNSSSNEEKANGMNEAPLTETDPSSKPDEKIPDSSSSNDPSKMSINTSYSVSSSLPDKAMPIKEENDKIAGVKDDDPDANSKQHDNDNHNGGENGNGISIQLEKEWTDMADGIVLYFEQALMARLLYPAEISQLLVLEDTIIDGDVNGGAAETTNHKIIESVIPMKVDIYGCDHLLRLLAAIPRILDQQLQESRKRKLQRKQNSTRSTLTSKTNATGATETTDEDAASAAVNADQDSDAFVEIGSMILAKLQDLSRFLQKNQSALFRSMYRKKNEQEIKRDIKIQKRQERRLKSVAAAAAASQNALQNNSGDQMEDTAGGVDDKPQ